MIHMHIRWYERNQDNFEPNYNKEHHSTIKGVTPLDCMKELEALKENHDLHKYTKIEIVYIY